MRLEIPVNDIIYGTWVWELQGVQERQEHNGRVLLGPSTSGDGFFVWTLSVNAFCVCLLPVPIMSVRACVCVFVCLLCLLMLGIAHVRRAGFRRERRPHHH